MKKYLLILLITFGVITVACSQSLTPPSSQPLRWPVSMIYNGDTMKIFFHGDTTKFYTDKGIFVFTKPIRINKNPVAMQKDVDTLFAQLTRKQDNIVPSTEMYYYAGNKTWKLMPDSLPAKDVYPWAKAATKPTYTATEVGLGNVDNTSDLDKPVSTATQSALDLKAALVSPTFTGTVSGITKSMVGLGNVDNTSDANKPVSSAQQDSINARERTISLSSALYYYRGDKTWALLDKDAVGLDQVDNTSDADKPVSTAQLDSINQRLRTTGTAANSNLLQGKDSTYIKANWGGGAATLPANTTGEDVVVGRSPTDGWIYFKIDSLFTGSGGGGGTSLNGLGFVKANGTTISYDNTTYQPLISPSGYTTQYYAGDKVFRTLPIYTGSLGVTKVGYDFKLGGATNDLTLRPSVNNSWNLLFGESNYNYNSIEFNGGAGAYLRLVGGGLVLGSAAQNGIQMYRSATYNGDYSSDQTSDNNIPSVKRVKQIVHDSVAAIFPANPTGRDILFGLDEYNNKIYFELDSLQSGTELNGTGFVKADGTSITYDNTLYQPQLNGTGFVKALGTSLTYDNTSYQPLIPVGATWQYYRGDKTWQTLNATTVGLGNVNNTSDLNKPISLATQNGLDGKEDYLGNPNVSGYVLSSNTTGTRSWIPMSGGSTHNPVTLGTANGLSLVDQVLTLGVSSTSTTGALTSTDWNTFNNKVTFPGFGTTSSTAAAGNHLHTGVYQSVLNGTGFVKMSGTSLSYDNTAYQPLSGAYNTTNLNLPSIDFSARTLVLGRNGSTANIKGASTDGNVVIDSYSASQGTFLQYYNAGNTYIGLGGGNLGVGKSPSYKVDVYGDVNIDPTYSYRIGGVPINKSTVGLGNVDNTSDLNKPTSTATAAELSSLWAAINAKRTTQVISLLDGSSAMSSGNIYSVSIPANTLSEDGDILQVKLYCTTAGNPFGGLYATFSTANSEVVQFVNNLGNRFVEVEIHRLTSSTGRLVYHSILAGGEVNLVAGNTTFSSVNWATANTLAFPASLSSGTVAGQSLRVVLIPFMP